jgi:uncharacterized protein YcbX
MQLGTIREVRRYPVKSMQGESLSRSLVGKNGVHGDRAYAVRDESVGRIQGGKQLPVLMQCAASFTAEPRESRVPPASVTLPDGTRTRTDAPDVNERLSALLGGPMALFGLDASPNPTAKTPGTYFDAYPIHLVTTATLSYLGSMNPAARFDVRRFRPNFVVETPVGETGLVEVSWVGKIVRLGEVSLEIVGDCPRCSMTIQAVGELPQDPSVLRTIVQVAAENVGVYAKVKTPGTVSVGDPVTIDGD